MKLILTAALIFTLGLNTVQANCIGDFEARTDRTEKIDHTGGVIIAVGSLFWLVPVLGPLVIAPIGAGLAWFYKNEYLPSSATKMTQLIVDSHFLIELPKQADDLLKQNPNALSRLDKIVKRATHLDRDDGDEFIAMRKKIAKIILESNHTRELCDQRLIKYRKMDEFVQSKL